MVLTPPVPVVKTRVTTVEVPPKKVFPETVRVTSNDDVVSESAVDLMFLT